MSTQNYGNEDHKIDLTIDLDSNELSSFSDEQLDAVCGGMRWIDVFMPYKNFILWPGGNYSPGRLC
jgi:hypothetical protein